MTSPKARILFVEDNEILSNIGKAVLESAGYDVTVATNGDDAMSKLGADDYSLIITDILMPVMDGYTLCYKIRDNEKKSHIPIIVYSAAYTSENDEEMAVNIGADRFIRKPSPMEVLLSAVKQLIDSPPTRKETIRSYDLTEVAQHYSDGLVEKLENRNEALGKAQAELLRNETRFQALVENNQEAITLRDKNGGIIYQSPGAMRMIGYEIDENADLTNTDLFHPDDVDTIVSRMHEVLRNPGTSISSIHRIKHRDGHYIWVEGTVTNLLDDANVNAVVGNFRDVTERKKQEEKLNNANRLYAFVSAINQTIVHVSDELTLLDEACRIAVETGKFEMAWIAMRKQSGIFELVAQKNASLNDLSVADRLLQNKDLAGSVFLTSQHKIINRLEEISDEHIKQYAAQRGFGSCVFKPLRRGGQIVGIYALFASQTSFFDEQEMRLLKEVAGDISFALDVIDKEAHRKRMEMALEQSEQNLRSILDRIPQSIFAKDAEGKYLFVNQSFANLYGMTPDEMVNRKSGDLFPEKNELSQFAQQDKSVLESGETLIVPEQIFTDHKGNDRVFYSTKMPYTKPGATSPAVLGIAFDITEQKAAEEERTRMVADIMQRNNDLEQFSYIISHNLRAPIANMLGFSELLSMPAVTGEDRQEMVDGILTSVKKLDEIAMDLNHILQVKERMNQRKEIVRFSGLVSNIKASIANIIRIEEVTINSDFAAVNEMFTVKNYLYSIFFNIISNSIKFRRTGVKPVIDIGSKLENGKLILTFKDNGLGMDIAKKGKDVFRLYKRFHFHVEGKGIGLYMVKTQVEAMGGKISVSSEVNEGTEFRIEFNTNMQ